MEYFNPLSVVIQGTGALFNSSKKHFIWRFELDQEEHSVELECSFLTNKRRVTFDGKLIFKGMKALLTSDFQYQFKHKNHLLSVFNHRNDANLIVDSLSFDIIYSQKILKKVSSFQSKPSSDQAKKPFSVESKDQPVLFAPEQTPKPARFISDEEYTEALKLSKNFETTNSKKSLRELLDKNLNQTKPPKGIFERDANELEFSDKNLEGSKSFSARAKTLTDNFLNIDDPSNEHHEELIDIQTEQNDDLFPSTLNDSKPSDYNPKTLNIKNPSKLTNDFLDIDKISNPDLSDLLEIDPKLQQPANLDFLSFQPSDFQIEKPFESDLISLNPSQSAPPDIFSASKVPSKEGKVQTTPFQEDPSPSPGVILKEADSLDSIFKSSSPSSLFSAPNK